MKKMANNFNLETKSVKDVIRECTLSAVIEIVTALRRENVDNGLLREIKAIHGNTTFDDLPACVKSAIYNATETTLVKLMAEGYGITTVDPKQGVKYP